MSAGGSNTPYPQIKPLKTQSILFPEDRPCTDELTVVTVTPFLDTEDAVRGIGGDTFASVTNVPESDTAGGTRARSRRLMWLFEFLLRKGLAAWTLADPRRRARVERAR